MGKVKTVPQSDELQPLHKASTPDGRENQMISLAYDSVEQRIRNGTASSAELVHFLKLASSKDRIEKEKLELEKQLLQAKTESIQAQTEIKDLYVEAIKAMKKYSGGLTDDDDEEELY